LDVFIPGTSKIVIRVLKHFDRDAWWVYMFTDFVKSLHRNGASVSTINWYKGKFTIWLEWLLRNGYENWDEINSDICLEFLEWLEETPNPRNGKPRTPRTILGYHKALTVGFNYGVERKFFKTNPMTKIPVPKVPEEVPSVYKMEWVDEMVKYISSSRSENKLRNISIIYVLLSSGIRRSELCNAKMENLDLERQELLVKDAKSKRFRKVGFNDIAKTYLSAYLEQEKAFDSEYVWTTPDGQKLKGYTVWLFLRNAADRAGVPRVPKAVHAFRSTMAVNWKHGPFTLKDAGGWKSLAMPEYYSRHGRQQLAANLQKNSN